MRYLNDRDNKERGVGWEVGYRGDNNVDDACHRRDEGLVEEDKSLSEIDS